MRTYIAQGSFINTYVAKDWVTIGDNNYWTEIPLKRMKKTIKKSFVNDKVYRAFWYEMFDAIDIRLPQWSWIGMLLLAPSTWYESSCVLPGLSLSHSLYFQQSRRADRISVVGCFVAGQFFMLTHCEVKDQTREWMVNVLHFYKSTTPSKRTLVLLFVKTSHIYIVTYTDGPLTVELQSS